MSKKETPKAEYKCKCIYAGRRIGGDGKTYQLFLLLPEKREMYFRGVKRVWLGYTYKCGDTSISTKPERTDDEHVKNPEWESADTLVDIKTAEKRAETKLKKNTKPAMREAIEALRPLMKNLSYFNRRSLIEYLATEAARVKK